MSTKKDDLWDFYYFKVSTEKGTFYASIQAPNAPAAFRICVDIYTRLQLPVYEVLSRKRGAAESADEVSSYVWEDKREVLGGKNVWVAAGKLAEYEAMMILVKEQFKAEGFGDVADAMGDEEKKV